MSAPKPALRNKVRGGVSLNQVENELDALLNLLQEHKWQLANALSQEGFVDRHQL